MKKIKKVYLPKWQRWFITPLFVLIWGLTVYLEFFSNEKDQMGTAGFVIMTIILLGVAGVMYAMTSGKLPAYIIEEEVKEEQD